MRAQIVTGSYYSVLGVEPLFGRVLSQQDEWSAGGELPVVLSDHGITFTVDTGMKKYDQPQTFALADRLLTETRNLPETASASIAVKPLLRGAGMRMSVAAIGGKRSVLEELNSDLNVVSPGYFQTLGVKLVAGRYFDESDVRQRTPAPVVVNQASWWLERLVIRSRSYPRSTEAFATWIRISRSARSTR